MLKTFVSKTLAVLCACVVTAFLSAKPSAGELTKLTPKQAVDYKKITNLKFSPDGSHLVCVVSQSKGDTTDEHLWMLDLATNEFRQFTFSANNEWEPEWSPDGSEILFLSDRQGKVQVFAMSLRGGEAQQVTSSINDVLRFHSSPSSKLIAFLSRDLKERSKEENDEELVDSVDKLSRLYVIDREDRSITKLTKGSLQVKEFCWMDPHKLLILASDQIKLEAWKHKIYSLSSKDGTLTFLAEPKQPYKGLSISPDGRKLAFVGTRESGPEPHDLFVSGTSGGAIENRTASIDRLVKKAVWQNNSVIAVSVTDGFKERIYRLSEGDKPTAIELPYSVRDFDIAKDGTLAFVGVDFNRLPELYLKKPNLAASRISHLQDGWDQIKLVLPEMFRFKSFDGTLIEAALFKPKRKSDIEKFPLVLLAHGGPASNFSADYFWFNSWVQLLVDRGYEVLLVNPRGSTGYGEKFIMANRADWVAVILKI